jgi:hypothetical protein
MQAFLYSPQSAIGAPVAWSVASAITLVTVPTALWYCGLRPCTGQYRPRVEPVCQRVYHSRVWHLPD